LATLPINTDIPASASSRSNRWPKVGFCFLTRFVVTWKKMVQAMQELPNGGADKDQPLPAKESPNHFRALEAENICILPEAFAEF
jgi:hypothetical protein